MNAATANIDENTATILSRLNSYVTLSKPRIAFMLVLTAAAGFYLGAGKGFDLVLFVHSMVAIALLSFGVSALNQLIERDTDKLMARTATRPLPSGKISVAEVAFFGSVLTIGAVVYFFVAVNTLTGILAISVVAGYVFLYTPLKTVTTASTAIGALPGAMPPLMGWTAATGEISLFSWFLFATLFLWQFPHFLAIAWMYREEYKAAGIKMLPVIEEDGKYTARQMVIFAVMLLPISIAPFFFGLAGLVFLFGATALGIWFLVVSIKTARAKNVIAAKKLMMVSVIYLPVYFALLVLGFDMEVGTIEETEFEEEKRPKNSGVGRGANSGNKPGGGDDGSNDGGDDGSDYQRPRPKEFASERAIPPNSEYKSKILMWFLLLVVLMTFGGLIGAYVVIATNKAAEWKPFDLPIQVWVSTAIIIAASIAFELGQRGYATRQFSKSKTWLLVTTVFGAAFISSQLIAWMALAARGFYMYGNPYSGFFYILTATHAVHVIGGICALGYVLLGTWNPPVSDQFFGKMKADLRATGWYWHAMGGLWIVLLLLLGFFK